VSCCLGGESARRAATIQGLRAGEAGGEVERPLVAKYGFKKGNVRGVQKEKGDPFLRKGRGRETIGWRKQRLPEKHSSTNGRANREKLAKGPFKEEGLGSFGSLAEGDREETH